MFLLLQMNAQPIPSPLAVPSTSHNNNDRRSFHPCPQVSTWKRRPLHGFHPMVTVVCENTQISRWDGSRTTTINYFIITNNVFIIKIMFFSITDERTTNSITTSCALNITHTQWQKILSPIPTSVHLKEKTIARVPPNGYRSMRKYSNKSMGWITYYDKITDVRYKHAWYGGEMYLKDAKLWADAYYESGHHKCVGAFLGCM